MGDSEDVLEQLNAEFKQEYEATRRLMSFSEFLDAFTEHPRRFARNSVQYVRDCFLHYGTETRSRDWGDATHFNLFERPAEDGRNRLVGQQRVQERIFNLLESFARQGGPDKLMLLHGPNGSAKSSLIESLIGALEDYSRTEEGALYRFNWIFPGDQVGKGGSIGFDGFSTRKVEESDLETFAYLDEEDIDATIPSALNDHPLLLIPSEQRRDLLVEYIDNLVIPSGDVDGNPQLGEDRPADGAAYAEELDARDESDKPFVASDYIVDGDISHTSRQIFDALLNAYEGELEKVLRHVQVERFFISRRYRRGSVVIEPQHAVDAGLQQLTVDESLKALPSSLQSQTIFKPYGDLVDANRGVANYDDLFKRRKELNQYLLATTEKGTVTLENRILHLDMVMFGTANEDYLDAFKQSPDYSSFKGRLELIRVPYLLDYQVEEKIYREQLATLDFLKPVAPHTMHLAALWAVLTRMKRPDPSNYDESISDVIAELTPLQKADLYAEGDVPEELSADQARELTSAVEEMRWEFAGSAEYEGRRGASPRDMKMILLDASQNDDFPTLSPLAIFEELSELVEDPSVFPFLQVDPDGPYHRDEDFIDAVRDRYLDILDAEIRSAMGLVEEEQYEELFSRYIDHVSAELKGEKVYNEITGEREEPDEELLDRIESTLEIEEELESFREDLISKIAAYSLDNPDDEVDYREIFPNIFDAMHEAFYESRQEQIRRIQQNILTYFEEGADNLSDAELERVEQTLNTLRDEYGYTDEYAREAVAFLLSNRYNREY